MTVTGHNPAELFDARPLGMSQAVSAAGRLVIVSGQVALDSHGAIVGRGDFEAQAVQVFENLAVALASAGATFISALAPSDVATLPATTCTAFDNRLMRNTALSTCCE